MRDMQMHMPDSGPGRKPVPWLIFPVQFVEEVIQIEWIGRHSDTVARISPFATRAVTVDFNTVAIRVREVDGFADKMVGKALDGRAGPGNPPQRLGKLEAGGYQDGKMVQAGCPRDAASIGILRQNKEVLRARAEVSGIALATINAKAERLLVEWKGTVEVGDGEMNVPNFGVGVNFEFGHKLLSSEMMQY